MTTHLDDVQLRTALRHHLSELQNLTTYLIRDERKQVAVIGQMLSACLHPIIIIAEYLRQETR